MKKVYKKILVEEDVHTSLKVLAAMQGITLSEVLRKLVTLHEKLK